MALAHRMFICMAMVLLISNSFGQHYIGLSRATVIQQVQQELPGFALTFEIENGDRSFIKFENAYQEQTLLIRFNRLGQCSSVSRMYNTWLEDVVRAELDSLYGKGTGNCWIYSYREKRYEVVLKPGRWYLTVITKSVKD